MITILYAYRNRELNRIKRSIDSLVSQKNQNFKVVFVDYGSNKEIALEVKKTVELVSFCTYHYVYSEFQAWNKSKALNFAIKKVDSECCFIADVDMIFHPEFTEVLEKKCCPNNITYFQVGFLSKEESIKDVSFEDYKIKFLSNNEATGMSLFPVEKLNLIRGFDEFFNCWGAEDTDIHNRLKLMGCEIEFYDEKVLLLHQWHPNYRKRETAFLNKEIQLSGIVELNHQHLKYNTANKIIKANSESWGKVIGESEYNELEKVAAVKFSNEVAVVDHFLFVELPNFKNGILSVCFLEDDFQHSLKYKIKKLLAKKVPQYYSLKEINDKLLLHIVSFYHQFPYTFKVADDLKSISFKIKKA